MQKGVSLYLAIVIVTVLLSAALGLNTIYMGQSKMIKETGNSVAAFYAANVGIESALTKRTDPRILELLNGAQETLANGASYTLSVFPKGNSGCAAPMYCIKSIGRYGKTSRAIEVSY